MTVTMAESSRMRDGRCCRDGLASGEAPAGAGTNALSPRRRVERPVPPPMATTRSWLGVLIRPLTSLVGWGGSWRCLPFYLMNESTGGSDFRVEKFGEAGIFGYAIEVRVEPSLEAILAVEADGLGEVLDAAIVVTGQAGEEGESVEGVVGGLLLKKDLLQVLASILVVALIEQRYGVVVPFFVGLEIGGALIDLGDAGRDVHTNAVGEVLRR